MKDKATVVAGTLGLLLVFLLAMVGVLIRMQTSLVHAVNSLETCRADGLSGCHIERDGVYYNVYGKGE